MSVCVSVCQSLPQLSHKVLDPILIKLGRIIDNHKQQVPYGNEINRFIKTEVTDNQRICIHTFSYNVPLLILSEVTSPFLSLERYNSISF